MSHQKFCYEVLLKQHSSLIVQKTDLGRLFFVEEHQHWITTALIVIYLFDSCFDVQLTASAELQMVQID